MALSLILAASLVAVASTTVSVAAPVVRTKTLATTASKSPVGVISVANHYLVGGFVNGAWVKPDVARAVLPAKADVTALSLGFANPGGVQFLNPKHPEDVCDWNWDYGTLGLDSQANPLAVVGATWPLIPRPIERLDPNGETYRVIVRRILQARAIVRPTVRITALYRVDLDGDGKSEVVLMASNFRGSGDYQGSTAPGDYDLMLVRSVSANKPVEQVVYFAKFGSAAGLDSDGTQHSLVAIADLDGDRRMEIVTDARYYESGETEIWAAQPNATSRWRSVASENCGV